MARRVRRLAVVVLVLLVVGAIALVLTTRPKLEDARGGVDRVWTPLRGPLSERYAKLAEANAQLAAAGGGERDVSRALGLRLGRWGELRPAAGVRRPHSGDRRLPGHRAALAGGHDVQPRRPRLRGRTQRSPAQPDR